MDMGGWDSRGKLLFLLLLASIVGVLPNFLSLSLYNVAKIMLN